MNNHTWRNIVKFKNRELIRKFDFCNIVKYNIQLPIQVKLRIVFISDTHFGNYPPEADKISREINNLNPDYIIFGGDIVSESSGLDDAFRFLNSLNASSAKLSVLGNWELKRSRCKNISYWRSKYATARFYLLHDKTIEFDDVFFTGISPSKNRERKFFHSSPNRQDKLNILIAHSPDDIVSQKFFFHIAFAGHTHAGQIRIPFFGALKTSSRYWKKFEYGLYERNDSAKLIVSSGLGTSCLPIRFLCPPEIVLAEIAEKNS